MKEFECWKNEVTQALADKGIALINIPDVLVNYWNSNFSVEDVLKVCMAYHMLKQPSAVMDSAKRCGCFHCTKFFTPADINWDWGIPCCPYCHVDSVLPETNDYPLRAYPRTLPCTQ